MCSQWDSMNKDGTLLSLFAWEFTLLFAENAEASKATLKYDMLWFDFIRICTDDEELESSRLNIESLSSSPSSVI